MNGMLYTGDSSSWQTLMFPVVATFPRFLAAFLVMPFFTEAAVPRQIRVGLLLVLVLVAYPGAPVSFIADDWNAGLWIAFLGKEILIGALIGYAMAVVLWALLSVGELIDQQVGFDNAGIFNPFGGSSNGPMTLLLSQIGVLLFMSFGGLQVLLQLLYESLVLWPPGSFTPDLGAPLRDIGVSASKSVLEIATRLVAPVIGALLIVELGIGLVSRLAPQVDAFFFSMPIKAVVGLLVMALLLAHLTDVVQQHFRGSTDLLQEITKTWQHR